MSLKFAHIPAIPSVNLAIVLLCTGSFVEAFVVLDKEFAAEFFPVGSCSSFSPIMVIY